MSNTGSISRIGRLNGLSSRRTIHTLATAVAYCSKKGIATKNKDPGEDYYLVKTWITPGAYQGTALAGVSDGVGGWTRHGVDPSYLSRGIMIEMGRRFKKEEAQCNTGELSSSKKLPDCQTLLKDAFTHLYSQGSMFAGGTTVCVGEFNPQTAELQVVNLGDSGAWLIRDRRVIKSTVPDVSGFTPAQLTVLPDWMSEDEITMSLDPEAQTAESTTQTWKLQENDILIFGTDGFFDNVSKGVALDVLRKAEEETPDGGPRVTAAELADKLLERAYYNSTDPNVETPFGLRCLEMDGFDYWGGKPDDITLVVAYVYEKNLDELDEQSLGEISKAPAS